MKRPLLLLLSFLLFCFSNAQIVGGEVDYRCLGNGRYEVFAHLDMFCADSIRIPKIKCLVGTDTLLADSTGYTGTANASGIDIVCPNSDSCGYGNVIPRLIRRSFRGIFLLDTFSACDVTFFVREPTTNYANKTDDRNWFYIETWVNRCLAPCDASPKRINEWPQVLAQNQDFIYSASVFNDLFPGDSFHYSFSDARTDKTSSVDYNGNANPYRWITFFGFPSQGLQWPAGLAIWHGDGNVAFRPTMANEKATMVVQVLVYRMVNGKMMLVGKKYIENGMQTVASPNNKVPKILGWHSPQVCPGQKKCFTVYTDDDDNTDTVSVSFWNSSIPDLEITQTTFGSHPTFEVCWTPDSSDVRNTPYIFTIQASDNACPIPGVVSRAHSIFVRPMPAASYTTTSDSCGLATLLMTPESYAGLDYVWQLRDTTQQLIYQGYNDTSTTRLAAGKYHMKLRLNTTTPCVVEYNDSLTIYSDYVSLVLTDSVVKGCEGANTLIGSLTSDPSVSYSWSDGGNTPQRSVVLIDSTIIYTLTTSRKSCSRTDSFSVWGERKPTQLPTHHSCDTQPIPLFAAADLGLIDSVWMGNGNNSAFYTLPTSYRGPIHYQTVGNCSYNDSIFLVRAEVPNLSFRDIWTDETRVHLILDSVYPNATYSWIINDSFRYLLPDPKIRFTSSGTQKVTLVVEKDSCTFSETRYISGPNGMNRIARLEPSFFPNPFKEGFEVKVEAKVEHIRLFNALGQEVGIKVQSSGTQHLITPASSTPAGFYWLWIETKQGVIVEKLIKE